MSLVDVLLQVVQMLTTAENDIGPARSPDDWIPDVAELKSSLGGQSAREAKITAFLGVVAPRWSVANAKGLIAKLGSVRTHDVAMRAGGGGLQPTASLPQSTVTAFYDRLALDNTGETTETMQGAELVRGALTPSAASATKDSTVRALMNLRRLDDVLVRVLAAQAAAEATATPMAEVMAMYRVEGDLAAPPSTRSLAEDIPPAITDAPTSLNPRPEISRLVLMFDAGAITSTAIDFALRAWAVQIAGLDEVGGLPLPLDSNFVAWSSRNWTAAGASASECTAAAAASRFRALHTGLTAVTKTIGSDSATIVTPDDPVAFVAGILAESVMLRRHVGRVDRALLTAVDSTPPAAPARLTPGMAYLRYHAGDEDFRAILARALLAAAESGSGARYAALRSAILSDVDVADWVLRLKPVKAMDDKASRVFLLGKWATVERFLGVPGNLALLSDFVETVDGTAWSTWKEHRGNLSRYRVLLDYYQRVFP